MKKLSLFIILFIIYSETIPAQVNEYYYFYPMKEGNLWVYLLSTSSGQQTKNKTSISSSMIANGHKYFEINSTYLRVDSNNANVYQLYTGSGCPWSMNDRMIDSLAARLNDSAKYNCNAFNIRCIDTNIRVKFGISIRSKRFLNTGGGHYGKVYAKGFGLISAYGGSGFNLYGLELLGCVIDGVLYGDTSMLVGINQISYEMPKDFSLFQNYPNPFNPTTHLRFEISEFRFVKLKIFDMLGREVQTLVNEQLQPGTYEVDFDGSNLPGGVYYYRLESNNYNVTKKMVLIK